MNEALPPASDGAAAPYRVLARKYRPTTFVDLVGQEALVRTLSNAIASGRIAQAYVLTGVRGVGKTSTARILARALNCVGPEGTGGPTAAPCGVCPHCRAIAEDRHVDVLEMDAASRTGVGDIRELIEGVRYRPTSARYKIYIIDEVHMLSSQAFNALLKTLEEPPAHVKFIFATTEIRKVPVTVLSRCQRFDLRRIDAETLERHFAGIAEREGVAVEPAAVALIARAADGSVRDGLSLLDQAIAHAAEAGGGGAVAEAEVRAMLGLADRTLVFDLFDATLKGDPATALGLLRGQYEAGADPAVVIGDLLELTHWLTRLKAVPQAADDVAVPEAERKRGRDMAARLGLGALTRTWQMLLKALGEVRTAPSPLQAAEMALIRLIYAAELPTPAEAVAALTGPAPEGGGGGGPAPGRPAPARGAGGSAPSPASGPGPGPATSAAPVLAADAVPQPATFEAVIDLFRARKEIRLVFHLTNEVHVVHFEPGRIEFRQEDSAPRDLANRLSSLLGDWTGRRWLVTVSNQLGQPTLKEVRAEAAARRRDDLAAHPLVRAVLTAFPGASIGEVRDLEPADALPEADAAETDDTGLDYGGFDTITGDDDP